LKGEIPMMIYVFYLCFCCMSVKSQLEYCLVASHFG